MAGFTCLVAAPAWAQDDAELAALLAEQSPEAGMAEARRQTADGDLAGAAASLERVLLADPNANDARLLYAATLCRLGDQQGARIELAKLDRQAISETLWREADEACGGNARRPLPAERDSGTGFSGEAYIGMAYDHDAAGAITLQTDFFGGSRRENGFAALAGARLNWRSEGFASDGGPYASASLTSKHDINGPQQDYDIGEARLGYGRSSGSLGWSAGPVVRHIRLLGDPYVTEYGAQGDVLFGNGGPRGIRLRLEGVIQDYKGGFPGNNADGSRFDASLAYETRLGAKGFATLGVGGELKYADERAFGYVGGRLFGALVLPFENRDYLTLSGTLRYVDFRNDKDFTFDRKDTRAFARLAYGLALPATDLFVEGALSYTLRHLDTEDGVSFRTYRSPGAETRLIWKF
jgi:hypothetical protein